MDIEKDENLICKNCNSTINKNIEFCSKCGIRNESYEEPVKINFDETLQHNNVVADENTDANEPVKKQNNKFKLVILAGIIILIGFLTINVFAKTFFPDKYVKSAILKTYSTIDKENKEYNEMPGIISLLETSDNVSEQEIYLQLEDLESGMDTDYVLGMLKGYGLKINSQNDLKDNKFHINIGLLDEMSEIVNADIFASSESLAVGIPALYNGHLGVVAENEIGDIESEYDMIRTIPTAISKYIKSSIKSKIVLKEKTEDLAKKIINLANFEKSKDSLNTYVTTIKSDDLTNLLKNYIIEYLNDENVKEMLACSAYLEEIVYSTYDEAVKSVNQMLVDLPSNIDYALDEVDIDDIVVSVILGKSKIIEGINLKTCINNDHGDVFKVEANSKIDSSDEAINPNFDLKIYNDYESVNIVADISNSKDGKKLSRDMEVTMDVSDDESLSFIINEDYDSSSNECLSNIEFSTESSSNDNINFSIESNGIYDKKDKIDFKNINVNIYEDEYNNFTIELSGYLQNKNINSVTKIEDNDIKYLNDMSEDELKSLLSEIYSNIQALYSKIY